MFGSLKKDGKINENKNTLLQNSLLKQVKGQKSGSTPHVQCMSQEMYWIFGMCKRAQRETLRQKHLSQIFRTLQEVGPVLER